MQGYAIEHDTPYLYRKSFTLPADYKGKRVILRFDGVYSHAILSVNGKQVREHHGGFTRWGDGCDGICTAGKKNEIQLEITDRIDDISYASGYAHHPIGGILRCNGFRLAGNLFLRFCGGDSSRFVIPGCRAESILYRQDGGNAEVVYSLTDPAGRQVPCHKVFLY